MKNITVYIDPHSEYHEDLKSNVGHELDVTVSTG
jgi:hypothetical protein